MWITILLVPMDLFWPMFGSVYAILLSLMAKHKYVTVFESYFLSDAITVMNMIHDDMVMGSIPAQIMMHHHPYCL